MITFNIGALVFLFVDVAALATYAALSAYHRRWMRGYEQHAKDWGWTQKHDTTP